MNPSKAELLEALKGLMASTNKDERTHCFQVLRAGLIHLPDEPAPSPDFFAENANNSPSPADECDHDFVLQHSSSINICRHCGIVETPSIAGRMAAKRALKEAFKHFDAPSPTTGAVVQWTEAHNAATYLQHHIGEGDEGACNALDTIDKFVLSHPAPFPTKPEGLEWDGLDLFFNSVRVGGIIIDAGLHYACFMSRSILSAPSFDNEVDAKLKVEAGVTSWLSPVSDASVKPAPITDTQAVLRLQSETQAAEIERLKAQVETQRKELSEYRSSTAYSDLYHEAQGLTAEITTLKAKLAKAEEVMTYNGTLKIIALREWFGGERYARDYEYLDQSFGSQAEAAIRGVLTHIAAQFTKGEEG